MNTFWTLWLAGTLVQPIALGERIEPGVYPSGLLVRARAVMTGHEVVYDTPDLAGVLVGVGEPIVVSATEAPRIEILLRAHGIFLNPLDVRGRPAFLFVSREPGKVPPQEIPYSLAIIPLEHARIGEVVKTLKDEIEEVESAWPEEIPRSRVVADERTNKILLRCASEKQLALYRELIARLDEPDRPGTRPALERWSCRARVADELAEELAREWKKLGRRPFRIVVHRKTNSLLLRLPIQDWPDVQALLERIDRR